jgi:hypothetical protein
MLWRELWPAIDRSSVSIRRIHAKGSAADARPLCAQRTHQRMQSPDAGRPACSSSGMTDRMPCLILDAGRCASSRPKAYVAAASGRAYVEISRDRFRAGLG